MRQKLFRKQFGTLALIVFLSLSFILIILSFMYNNFMADEKYKSLQKSCQSVKDFVELDMSRQENNYDEREAYYIIKNISNVTESEMFITNYQGTIEVCTCDVWDENNGCEHTGTKIDTNALDELITDQKSKITTLDIYSSPHYVSAISIEINGQKTGYIVATDSIDNAKVLMQRIAKIYVISAIAPLLIIYIALYIMTRRVTKPLRLMSEAAKAMAKGDFSRRIPVTSNDEIGQLALSFNQMTNSLVRLEETRKSFIANISHELRTPMTTIGGFIDGMLDGTIDAEKQPYYLNIVHNEIIRLSRMVESMLSISRLEANQIELKKEPFDFKEMVLNVVIAQERRITKKQIEIIGLDTLPDVTIVADKDLIHRVVYNLVDNAVKFTNEGGRIEFAIGCKSNKLSFKVQNTGKGIPENELPFVFERFYKVDKSRSADKESTGLGLYIAKTIITNHGGLISVSSIENQFTIFEFNLPIGR